ncbi:hypothetical protein MCERE19_00844 [Spirosomataceae bacterium]
MKTNHFFLYIILLLLPYISFSQNRLNDLTLLNDILKKTPSFKSQTKGQRKKEFDKLYEKLKSKVDEKNTDLRIPSSKCVLLVKILW